MRCAAQWIMASLVCGCGPHAQESSPFQIVINEVAAGGDQFDPIELLSLSDETIDLEGFWYIDSWNNPENQPFVFGADALEPGDFLIMNRHTFGLSEEGDRVALFDAESRLVDVVEWKLGRADRSFCRIPDGTGRPRSCSAASIGEPNIP